MGRSSGTPILLAGVEQSFGVHCQAARIDDHAVSAKRLVHQRQGARQKAPGELLGDKGIELEHHEIPRALLPDQYLPHGAPGDGLVREPGVANADAVDEDHRILD